MGGLVGDVHPRVLDPYASPGAEVSLFWSAPVKQMAGDGSARSVSEFSRRPRPTLPRRSRCIVVCVGG